ncbi:hypothetical protein [Steroidobacter denitrificans]|uniref:hypothetical protein n=1 Tax=Steroidobacter denitrificans TaxID=465721 RepID=UPI000B3350B3|nr:hypothetical protein [Steroidobacter denitrificans]
MTKFSLSTGMASVICTISSIVLVPTTQAAPTITTVSGTAAHGELITVSGSGFGTRGAYNNSGISWKSGKFLNFRFKDFEDRQLNSDGFYAQRGGSSWSANSSELSVQSGGPTNSGGYLRRAFSSSESGGVSTDVSGAGNQLYTTFKFMMPSNTQSGKFFRFYANSPQNNIYLSAGCGTSYQVRGYSECTAGTCSPTTEWGSGPSLQAGKWHRIEVWADASSNTFSVSVDGTQAWSKNNWLASTLGLNSHTIDYPNMIDSAERGCGTAGSYNIDDIFIDFTRARIEIGDAATWSAVRQKEVQLPISWANGSVQFRVNTGEFSSGKQAYLYVIDSSGNVNSQGYPITIGTTSKALASPTPPTNVSVQ